MSAERVQVTVAPRKGEGLEESGRKSTGEEKGQERKQKRRDVLEENIQYAIKNAFSWPVSLVIGLTPPDHKYDHEACGLETNCRRHLSSPKTP